MPSGWPKSNPHRPKLPCPVLPLPKPRYLRGQRPQPQSQCPRTLGSPRKAFPAKIPSRSPQQKAPACSSGAANTEAGEATSSHSISMKKTPTEMQTRLAACPSFLHLAPSLFRLGSSSFRLGSCRNALSHPLPLSQYPRGGLAGKDIPNPAAWDAQGTGHCQGWALGRARGEWAAGPRKRGGNLLKLAGGNFTLIF